MHSTAAMAQLNPDADGQVTVSWCLDSLAVFAQDGGPAQVGPNVC